MRYGKALFWASGQNDAELAPIRDELLAAGDREGAAELEAMLVVMAWHRSDGTGAARHLDAAVELVRDALPSPAKAYVLSQVSRYRMLASRNAEAIAVGREALAMAEQFGLDSVRAATLNNIGTARFQAGDERGLEDLQRAIELATETNSVEICRAHINFAACLSATGSDESSIEHLQLAAAAAERFGDWTSLLFARGQLPQEYQTLGRWDEALALAEQLLGEAPEHYMASQWLTVRALISVARDDVEHALADVATGLALARRAGDPQAVDPQLREAAFVYLQAGRLRDAAALLDELFSLAQSREEVPRATAVRPEFVLVARAFGQERRALALLDKLTVKSVYHDAARAALEGDLVAAAGIHAQLGEIVREALFRLAAAEALVAEGRRTEADEQLLRGLAVARELGAKRWIRQGEALLARSA
jgi:tetratricopeptide (TPR) repeat protein